MPRAHKVLDECFIESPNKKKIQCTICEPPGSLEWMFRDGDKKHLKSNSQKRNVDAKALQLATRAAVQSQNSTINSALGRLELPASKPIAQRTANIPSAEEEAMWDHYQMGGASFSAGDDPNADGVRQQAQLEEQAEQFGRWNAASIARNLGFHMEPDSEPILGEHDEEDALLCKMMDNAQLTDPPSVDDLIDIEMGQTRAKSCSEWDPYPSKMVKVIANLGSNIPYALQMFLLDTLDNLPRQRVSNSLMKVFLWILREGGAWDVPSLDSLRKVQSNLHQQGGVPTVPWTSSQGNVFHLNDIRTIIAKDYANPLTRELLHFYPEIPEGSISEAWHAQKWRREIDRDTLTPMIVDGHRHYYVNELARLHDGSFVIPLCWVLFKGQMHADAIQVSVDGDGVGHIDDTKETLIRAADLLHNFLDLEAQKVIPTLWDEHSLMSQYPSKMPNPLRKLANSRPMYTSFVDLFFDDVSGNRSKSWNKHYNCYCTHRNLPRRIVQQEFHTHFVTTSPHASSSEQFEGIKSLIVSTHTHPIGVDDSSIAEEAAVRLFINTGPSDNPMGSEMTGHIGAKGNYLCRKCHEGIPRTAAETLEELHKQVELACLGVKDAVEARQTDTGVKDAYTNYWIDDLIRCSRALKKGDPTLDSAEIVTQLMDWVKANESKIDNPFLSMKGIFIDVSAREIYELMCVKIGFDVSKDTPIEILHTILLGIVKYIWHTTHTRWNPAKKSTYMLRLQATNTVGLSIPSIRASYIMQFANSLIGRQFKQVAQTCVFHMYDLTDGLQFATWKAMGELLPLLWYPEIDDMEQYLTDVETAVSNVLDLFAMLDPSKIISKNKLHIMAHTGTDVRRHGPLLGKRAGWAVRDFLSERPILQALLGWTSPKQVEQGSVRLTPLKRVKGQPTPARQDLKLSQTAARTAINVGTYGTENTPTLGCIKQILTSCNGSVVILDVFRISDERHTIFNLSKLSRRQGEETLLIVPATSVEFIFNVQHDCYSAKCTASGSRAKTQEPVESSITEAFIEHQPLDEFVINTTAFHNAHLLRRCLPRHAWAPVPMFTPEYRIAKHTELAGELRGTHATRKAALAAAAAAKKDQADPTVADGTTKKRKRAAGKRRSKAPAKTAPRKKAFTMCREPKRRRTALQESDAEPDHQSPEVSGAETELDDDEDGSGSREDSDGISSSEEEPEYVARPTRRPRGKHVPE
ncbi:hypothetical protein C8R43DRAFT_949420 [Mycena crocata]|nr:hypothetical protein C8R43DRAFT_949420 [Mycena crocata]